MPFEIASLPSSQPSHKARQASIRFSNSAGLNVHAMGGGLTMAAY
jgi:hypothetical protein